MGQLSKIVFTGISGLLGGYFSKLKSPGYELLGVADNNVVDNGKYLFKVDITDKEQVLDFVKKIKPDVIVHAASIGNVDYCESHPDEAFRVNLEGTKNVIEAAKEIGAKIIFISSNAVYDGENTPYDENAKLNPIDIYGKTKVEGERIVLGSNLEYVIIRLMTMYGWPQNGGRANPVTWIIDSLKKGEKINVVNDIYNNHLWANQAAEAIWEVIKQAKFGHIFNVAGLDCVSRYDLALKVAEIFDLDSSLVNPVSSDFFKAIAKRPKNTCFNITKMANDLGLKPLSIEEGLNLMKAENNI